jgi:hypothetical protein
MTDPYATARQLIYAPPDRRKTFVADMPSDTHYRVVSCAEAADAGECKHYAQGFAIPLVPGGDRELFKAQFIQLGYHFSEGEVPEHLAASYPKGTRFLVFPPEQRCLTSYKVPHRLPLDHDPILAVKGGDFRQFTGRDTNNMRVDSWVNQLQNTIGELNDEIKKG